MSKYLIKTSFGSDVHKEVKLMIKLMKDLYSSHRKGYSVTNLKSPGNIKYFKNNIDIFRIICEVERSLCNDQIIHGLECATVETFKLSTKGYYKILEIVNSTLLKY